MIKRFIDYMKGWRNVYRLIWLQRELQKFANEPKQPSNKSNDNLNSKTQK